MKRAIAVVITAGVISLIGPSTAHAACPPRMQGQTISAVGYGVDRNANGQICTFTAGNGDTHYIDDRGRDV